MTRLYSALFAATLLVGTAATTHAQPNTGTPPDDKTTPTVDDKTPTADDKTKPDTQPDVDVKPKTETPPAVDNQPTTAPAPAPVTVYAKKEPAVTLPLKVSASFFTRYELRENYADVGKAMGRFSEFDAFVYRARLGLATAPVDIGDGQKVGLRFVPQVSGFWADRGGTLVDSPMQLHEAVMRLTKDKFWLDVGRFEMIYGDHFVIGNVGWHETARSFDGARAHFPIGGKGAWLETFVTQVGEGLLGGTTSTVGEGDKLFVGAYLGLGPNFGKGTALDAYALSNVWLGAEQDVSPEVTLGSRFKTRSGNMDARVEAGVQLGKRPGDVSVFAFQGEGEVGFHVGKEMRVAAGGFFASGDDPDTDTDEGWNQLYPTAHKFLGWMDIIGGRSNAMGGMAKLKYKVDKKLIVGAHGHFFMRPQTADGVDSYTGIELDTFALKKLGKGLAFRAGYHIFLPNETGPLGNDTPVHYIEFTFKYTLK